MFRRLIRVVAVVVAASSVANAQQKAPVLTDPPPEPSQADASPQVSPTSDEIIAAEAAKARLFAIERLRTLGQPAEKGLTRDKATESRLASLREVFKTRERLILDWEKTRKAHVAILNPEPSPESEVADLKVALEQLKVGLEKAKGDATSLLPENLRNLTQPATEAALSELKDAVNDADEDAANLTKELESLTAAQSRKTSTPLASAKAEREEIRKRIAALGPRATDADAVLSSATSSESREIARERIINLDWEGKLEAERLKEAEARIDLETRRVAVTEVKAQVLNLKLNLSKMTGDLLRGAYAARLERQKAELKKASAAEEAREARTKDPLEKYRARRNKELFDQQALLREKEQEKAAPAVVSLEDQTKKADDAEKDFQKLKNLVEGGRSSSLVAQRLNNSYRRLSSDRGAINRVELTQVVALLAKYENELTAIELDQLNDDRGDRALRENLLSSLPRSRQNEALKAFAEAEKAHHEVLEKRKIVVMSLEERTEKTRQEILRRVRVLDAQYAFVRTHLFWVRDSQPIGTDAIDRLRVEASDLGRTLLQIAAEPWSRSHWERISGEFVLAGIGLLGLPYALYRIRRILRVRLARTPEVNLPQPV